MNLENSQFQNKQDSEPAFEHELGHLIRSCEALPELPSKIWRKRVQNFEKKAFGWSGGIHLSLIVVLFMQQQFPGLFDWTPFIKKTADATGDIRSAIRVEVVELPRLTLQELQNINILDQVGTPAPLAAPVKALEPPKDVMALPAKPKLPAPPKPKAPPQPTQPSRLDSMRAQLNAEARRREIVAQAASGRRGREALGGNILSEGYNLSGEVATSVDVYQGRVRAHVHHNWSVPSWMLSGSLNARVLVKVAPDGRILSKEFIKKSGNAEFDQEVILALERSNPLPAPPANFATRFLEEGIEWGFPN